MPDASERLAILIEANTKSYENAMKRIEQKTNQAIRASEQSVKRLDTSLRKGAISADIFSKSIGMAGLGAISIGSAALAIGKAADAWTVAANKLAAASQVAGRQARPLEEVNKIATATRTGLTETVDLYAKLLRATKDVAQSEAQVARATVIINKAFKAGGAAASEQAAGILQLAQGLGSGILQGDELRSIRENAPLLAEAIAREFKTTVGGLKELGAEGELTSDRIFKAILKGGFEIEAAFASTKSTVSDAMTLVMNALMQTAGEIDNTTGASRKLIDALEDLATVFRATGQVARDFADSDLGYLFNKVNEFLKEQGKLGGAFSHFLSGGGIIGPAAEKYRAHEAIVGSRPPPEVEKGILDLRRTVDELDKAKIKLEQLQQLADKGIIAGPEMTAAVMAVETLTNEVERLKTALQDLGKAGATAGDSMADGFERARIAAHKAFGEFANIPLIAGDMAKQVIRQFEGFRSGAYWDSNAYRLGYGSDTLGGTGRAVTQFSTTTKEEAERDLDVRIAAFQRVIVEQIGSAFGRFTEPVQAALTSVAYNYGRLPESVAAAARTGDTEAVARAVESLSANPQRRAEEARLIRTGQFGLTETHAAEVSAAEKAAEAQKDLNEAKADFEEKLKLESAALDLEISNITKSTAEAERASVKQDLTNQLTAAGIPITEEYAAAIDALADKAAARVQAQEAFAAEEQRSQEIMQDTIARADAIRNLASDVIGGMVNDLRNGASAAEVFANALEKIAQKLIDIGVNQLVSGMFGAPGTLPGGIFGGLFGAPAVSSQATTAMAAAGGLFAKGGIMTSHGPVPLNSYQGGGIANSPQMALFGEGSTPEAYVPLPNGRSIPVNLNMGRLGGRGAGGGGRQKVAVDNTIRVEPSLMFVTTVDQRVRQGQAETLRAMPSYLADRQRRGI